MPGRLKHGREEWLKARNMRASSRSYKFFCDDNVGERLIPGKPWDEPVASASGSTLSGTNGDRGCTGCQFKRGKKMRIKPVPGGLVGMVAVVIAMIFIVGSWPQTNLGHASAPCSVHSLKIGMTKNQILNSDWCYPNNIQKSTSAPGKIEYWFYGYRKERSGAHTGMILVDDGVVTYFSEVHNK
jgi:hypothetical protein